MTPKYIRQEKPENEYIIGGIRIIRIGRTIYLYTPPSIHPLMTRKFGDERVSIRNFRVLKTGLDMIWKKESVYTRFLGWLNR